MEIYQRQNWTIRTNYWDTNMDQKEFSRFKTISKEITLHKYKKALEETGQQSLQEHGKHSLPENIKITPSCLTIPSW